MWPRLRSDTLDMALLAAFHWPHGVVVGRVLDRKVPLKVASVLGGIVLKPVRLVVPCMVDYELDGPGQLKDAIAALVERGVGPLDLPDVVEPVPCDPNRGRLARSPLAGTVVLSPRCPPSSSSSCTTGETPRRGTSEVPPSCACDPLFAAFVGFWRLFPPCASA